MSWAGRRQFTYFSIFALFVGGILFLILYPVFHKAPTCMDGKQNGTEKGVDCGGSCQLYCPFEVSKPIVLWSRAFHVAGTSYNLLAYIENQNKSGAVYQAPYEFRIYDTNNKLIGRREGTTFIPPNQRYAIFESRFDAGTATPRSTTFSFVGDLVWVKKEPVLTTLPLKVDRILIGDDTTSPSLSARLVNESVYNLPEFDVITILYDEMKNAIAVSKTHTSGIESNTSIQITFTWPLPFSATPITKDVLPQINPFTIAF